MLRSIFTNVKIDSEPRFSESARGEYCYFIISSTHPINGVFFKAQLQGFDHIPEKVRGMAKRKEKITGDSTLKGTVVDIVCEIAPYERNGEVYTGYKIKDIDFTPGYPQRTAEKTQATTNSKPQNDFMSLANKLNENPFG